MIYFCFSSFTTLVSATYRFIGKRLIENVTMHIITET